MEPKSKACRGSASPYLKSDNSAKFSDQELDQEDNDNVFLEDSDDRHHHHQQQHQSIASFNIRIAHSKNAMTEESVVTSRVSSTGGHRRSDSKSISDDCSDQSQCESPHNRGLTTMPFSIGRTVSAAQKIPVMCRDEHLSSADPFQSEKEFIDYLLSLPSSKADIITLSESVESGDPGPPSASSRVADVAADIDSNGEEPSNSTFLKPGRSHQPSQQPSPLGGSQSPKIGLDHLENLCKLMEQLGELREQNLKLQKRVQYLEEVRCLNEMRKDLKEALEMVSSAQQQAAGTTTTMPTSVGKDPRLSLYNYSDISPTNMSAAASINAEQAPIGFQSFDYDSDMVLTTPGSSNRLLPSVSPVAAGSIGGGSSPKRAKGSVKLRKMISKQQRNRSQSMGDDELFRPFLPCTGSGMECSSGTAGARKTKAAKVSKWSKVKEALKWERAQTLDQRSSVVGSASATSGDARSSFYVDVDPVPQVMISKANVTLAPSSKPDMSPYGSSLVGDTMYVDSASSKTEQVQCRNRANREIQETPILYLTRESYLETSSDEEIECTEDPLCRKGRSLERDAEHKVYVRYSQSENEAKKLSKGPWGKVKNIIQTRKDSLKRKHRKSGGEAEFRNSNVESDLSNGAAEQVSGADDMWMPSEEYGAAIRQMMALEHQQLKSKHSSSSSNYGGEDFVGAAVVQASELLGPPTERPAKSKKPKPQLTIQSPPEDLLILADDEIKSRYPSTCSSSTNVATNSPTSPRKSKWTKVKSVFINRREGESQGATGIQRPQSVPASPINLTSFNYDDIGILEDEKDWEDRKQYPGQEFRNYDNALALLQSIIKEKQAETELIPYETKRHLEELQRNISHDFSKKLQEWEKLKTNYHPGKSQDGGQHYSQSLQALSSQTQQQQQHSPKLDRKGSGQKNRKGVKSEKGKEKFERDQKGLKQREKELQWLEKQLQKIEREKQRLAKERQKYLEREARLEKMKETMMKPSVKNEILVRTSAGEFRFEGISQTFTRKLYEWEEMKGIGPEVSTIALLDSHNAAVPQRASSVRETSSSSSNFDKQSPTCAIDMLSPPLPKYGRLDRNRSRSESSIADIANVQTSTTSLAPDDILVEDYDAMFADLSSHSRANSEPDMVFNLTMDHDPPYALEVEELHIEESIPCLDIPAFHVEEPVYSYAPSEVTRLIDSSGSSDVERESSNDDSGNKPQRNLSTTKEEDEDEAIQDKSQATAVKDEGSYGNYLLDEDISLLETLTAKEEICRQLETDLEKLDGKMKIMFQQHSEEIQKLRSQEVILKGMEVGLSKSSVQSQADLNKQTSTGSPENSIKQKQLIDQLKARIVELETAGECLKREREELEETFKKHTEHQGQLTQHLAARITELQRESSIRSADNDPNSHERISSHSKKKAGVVKVQNLSAELLQQAKTLEQALQDRNSTIRQLQWELLQRDMSAIQLQGELEKVKEKSTLGVFRSDSKLKKNHNRSWSSVDAAFNGQKNSDTKKGDSALPLQIHRISDNPEFSALPMQLTKKVRELKTELMRLWSSGESTTSIGSEADDGTLLRANNMSDNGNGNGTDDSRLDDFASFATSSCCSTDQSSSVETVITTARKQNGAGRRTPTMSPKMAPKNAATTSLPCKKVEPEPAPAVLTTRRVSDTSIPAKQLPTTPEFGRQQRRLKSKLQNSPETATRDTNTAKTKAELTTTLLEVQHPPAPPQPSPPPIQAAPSTAPPQTESQLSPKVSRIPSRIPSQSPATTPKFQTTMEHRESSADGASVGSINYTISLKPKHSRAAVASESIKKEPDRDHNQSATATEDGVMEESLKSIEQVGKGQFESCVTLPNPLKVTGVPKKMQNDPPIVSAVIPLPRKQLVRSPALREASTSSSSTGSKRRSPYKASGTDHGKPSQTLASLHRQNAQDPGSSSDTDTEDSGVTFTINIGSKSSVVQKRDAENSTEKEKKVCANVATAVSRREKPESEGNSEMSAQTRAPLKSQERLREAKLESQDTVIANSAYRPNTQLSGLRSPSMQRSRFQDPSIKTGCGGSIRSPPPSPSSSLWRKMYGGNIDSQAADSDSACTVVTPVSSPGPFRNGKTIAATFTEIKTYSPLSSPAMVKKMASSLMESHGNKTKELQSLEEPKLTAPETPVVKSRSTRKLKIPSSSKTTDNGGSSSSKESLVACSSSEPPLKSESPTTVAAPIPMEFSPISGRRLLKDPAPSVKTMIEKYNLKLAKEATVAPPSPSLLRSPQLSLGRTRYGVGVQKSTSFTAAPSVDPTSANCQHQAGGDGGGSVVKSASAGRIDGGSASRNLSGLFRMPPMSPELPSRRTTMTTSVSPHPAMGSQSPIVGIASRIPRCLKAISEQEGGEVVHAAKDSSGKEVLVNAEYDTGGGGGGSGSGDGDGGGGDGAAIEARNLPAATGAVVEMRNSPSTTEIVEQEDNLTSNRSIIHSRSSAAESPGFHSPITGVRALQLRRAREEFLTKIPSLASNTSSIPDRSSHSSCDRSSNPGSPVINSAYPQSSRLQDASDPILAPPSPVQPTAVATVPIKPKGILKTTTRREVQPAQPEIVPTDRRDLTDGSWDVASNRIIKSASAGTMDEAVLADLIRQSQDCGDGLSDDGSKTSETSTQQQTQKSGLFNFKFRKAKLKQKKESQSFNTVKALCRQSLVVDLLPPGMIDRDEAHSTNTTVSTRSCPSSPELQPKHMGKSGWLIKPKILFKSK